MLRFFQLLLIGISIALLAYLLPWLYRFATLSPEAKTFVVYSRMIDDFAIVNHNADKKLPKYSDLSGRSYTQAEFDSILPMLYYRQLLSDGRLPDTLFGHAVNSKLIAKENFVFRHAPAHINRRNCELYFLLESASSRVDLQMPDDVFRFTKEGIEFVDMTQNKVKREKTALFRKAFTRENVRLPISKISGNPTVRKDYDEGYFFSDTSGRLFHFKQVQGQPYLRHIPLPERLQIAEIFITEFLGRHHFAFLSDTEGGFYALKAPDYSLQRVELNPFFPQSDELVVFGNMLDWTLRLGRRDSIYYTAVDAQSLSTIRTWGQLRKQADCTESLYAYLFPFELNFTSPKDKYFQPRINNFSCQAIFFNLLLLITFLGISKRRNTTLLMASGLAIACLGIFAFIPLIIIRKG